MINFERTDCIKSYFELVAMVNKGNRVINEPTQVSFFIEDRQLFIGISRKQKIVLCKRTLHHWTRAGNLRHEGLEAFLCIQLNGNKIVSGNIDEFLKRELFKLE